MAESRTLAHGDNGAFVTRLEITRRPDFLSVSCGICNRILYQQHSSIFFAGHSLDKVVQEAAVKHAHLEYAFPPEAKHA